jgi:TPP-dependent pyruvate/acetoin dehydrogenase alpha subunit
MKKYTPEELIKFEEDVCAAYVNKEIRAPIHLYYGNEKEIIAIFEKIRPQDWVFCSWRSHYQALLKGVPPEQLLADIKKGRSIALNYPEYRIYSSAIVTGNIPIATGKALGIKRLGLDEHVYCFVGDMTSETGCFFENWKYAANFDLPITFIVEDNGVSVCTDTKKTWGVEKLTYEQTHQTKTLVNGKLELLPVNKVIYYSYKSKYPHAGHGGGRITF